MNSPHNDPDTDLAAFIADAPMVDTHEHLNSERGHTSETPDVLVELFDHYTLADLAVAGASDAALKRLVDVSDPDVAARFLGVRDSWLAIQHTGYGDGVSRTAKRVFALDEIVVEALPGAQKIAQNLHLPGERLRLLRDIANLSQIQIDDFRWECAPDESGPDFFYYDLSAVDFAHGNVDVQGLHKVTGVTVTSPDTLRDAIDGVFERFGPYAIAVKTQHAYRRTLLWNEYADDDIAELLARTLASETLSENERNALGDWMLARAVEAAIRHNLPIKIHTGYYAGHSYMPIERIAPGLLCNLLRRYPNARFVLMHAAYPYGAELVALAKHFPNVYLDLCWAWSIDPYAARDFVRRALHAAPSNKLFAFGGDSFRPNAAVSYAFQARDWLTRTLQSEVDERLLTEPQAIRIAQRWMAENQQACFRTPSA